jgi:hypothetical protein
MYRGENYGDVDYIFREISKLQALNLLDRRVNSIRTLSYKVPLENLNHGLWVSNCVCKGANA